MNHKLTRLAAAAIFSTAAGLALAQPGNPPVSPAQGPSNPSPSGPKGVGSQDPMQQPGTTGTTGTSTTGAAVTSGEPRRMRARAPRADRN